MARTGASGEGQLHRDRGRRHGLVILHAADNAFPGWVEYEQMVGCFGVRAPATASSTSFWCASWTATIDH